MTLDRALDPLLARRRLALGLAAVTRGRALDRDAVVAAGAEAALARQRADALVVLLQRGQQLGRRRVGAELGARMLVEQADGGLARRAPVAVGAAAGAPD